MTPKSIFEGALPGRLKSKGDDVLKVNAVYQFNISGPEGGSWWVDATKSGGAVGVGENPDAKCTISMADNDFIDMVNGKLNAQTAFFAGKLKIKGDVSLALMLGSVLGF
ncbi:MAG: sterol-binding protein [Candidatus Aminicenantes bacterium RBG_13_63_10]|nr:MAG: sterol-binding protein [Candidatus Aminicenantes bacterium RBG_13_63_10]